MMKPLLLSAVVLTVALGCDRAKPVRPLPLAQLVPALEEAFQAAQSAPKRMATEAAASLKTNGTQQAFAILQALSTAPDLADSERKIVLRSLATLREELATQPGAGTADQAGVLKEYNSGK